MPTLKNQTPNRQQRRAKASAKHPRAPRATQHRDAIAFTTEGFQANGGPGKTSTYALIKAGVLETFTDALGRRLITGDSARAYLKPKT